MSVTLSVRQLQPFGVELTNINLKSPEQRLSIQNLLYQNGVVVIPANGACAGADPIHNDDSLLKLASIWGELEKGHPVNESVDDAKHVQVLETMGDSGIPADSFLFHSDISWRVNPSRASVLCGRIIPGSGGNTRFRSANMMYRSLSPELQERLHGISGIHSLQEGYARVGRPDAVKNEIQAIHPAVIKHPNTGVPLLYFNENFTVALVGMSDEESSPLLARVFEQSACSSKILSHTWTVGDVVIWDNYGVQHQALADYDGLRRMHRVVVHDPHMRTARYVEKNTISESMQQIEYYLRKQGDDNRMGYDQWAVRYEHDAAQAGYNIPLMATDLLAQHLSALSDVGRLEARILDVAAGTGLNALHLMQNHHLTNIEAMDVSTGMMFEAQRRELYRAYHEEDANKPFPFSSGEYDAVLCIGGLGIAQIRAQPALEQFVRVTKKGGLVVMSMREAEVEYTDEVQRLVESGVAEVVHEHAFVGIEQNKNVRHCIFVLQVRG